tara:strand:- start:1585 stop:2439 length:855 start_codon:yes stop_codon:yes gene_type:complete
MSITLAKKFNAEIVSADSRQLYRELAIGTAKPTREELNSVTHHFIDSHSINTLFSAGEYERVASAKIQSLHKKNQLVLAVGGSTLYLKALWEGFDEMPEIDKSIRDHLNKEIEELGLDVLLIELKDRDPKYYREVDRSNHQRVVRALEVIRSSGRPFSEFRNNAPKELPYRNLKIGLELDRDKLFDRINKRMDLMIAAGLFEEAETLIDYKDHNALQTVGYSEIFGYLEGLYDKEEAIRLLKRNSRRYAKRQMTWFRRYDDIHWFGAEQVEEIAKLIELSLPSE